MSFLFSISFMKLSFLIAWHILSYYLNFHLVSMETNKITKITFISMIIIFIKSPGASGRSLLVICIYIHICMVHEYIKILKYLLFIIALEIYPVLRRSYILYCKLKLLKILRWNQFLLIFRICRYPLWPSTLSRSRWDEVTLERVSKIGWIIFWNWWNSKHRWS